MKMFNERRVELEIICDNIMRWVGWCVVESRREQWKFAISFVAPTHPITNGIITFSPDIPIVQHVRIFWLLIDGNFNPFHIESSHFSHFYISVDVHWMRKDSTECGEEMCGIKDGNESSSMHSLPWVSSDCFRRIAHNCFTIRASVMRLLNINCTSFLSHHNPFRNVPICIRNLAFEEILHDVRARLQTRNWQKQNQKCPRAPYETFHQQFMFCSGKFSKVSNWLRTWSLPPSLHAMWITWRTGCLDDDTSTKWLMNIRYANVHNAFQFEFSKKLKSICILRRIRS